MAKKISKEMYNAYLQWIKLENRATDLHFALSVLMDKHLGPDHDRLDNGKLIVELARMRIAEEDGVSPSGKASVSGTDSVGSNPTTPTKKKKTITISADGEVKENVDEELQETKGKRKRVAVAGKKKPARKVAAKRVQQGK